MDKLNSLRRDAYEAASNFLQAQGDLISSLKRIGDSKTKQATASAHSAGSQYKTALDQLIEYLSAPERIIIYEAELLRMQELAEILKRELALLDRQQSAR